MASSGVGVVGVTLPLRYDRGKASTRPPQVRLTGRRRVLFAAGYQTSGRVQNALADGLTARWRRARNLSRAANRAIGTRVLLVDGRQLAGDLHRRLAVRADAPFK